MNELNECEMELAEARWQLAEAQAEIERLRAYGRDALANRDQLRAALAAARAEAAALRDAIAAFFEVDDETAPMDYGDHTGMTWEDAGKRAQAEDNLRAALGTGTAGDGQ